MNRVSINHARSQSFFRRAWLLLFIALIPLFTQSCSTIVSSPEGTITTHVQDSGVLVYAPRAARAQKVVFDTSDKQMIHESDTPFRKFFNSHSNDFAPGKVDYAKTTILNDVVNRLNNKDYIRLMVKDIIDQHKGTAIAPFYSQIEKELNSALKQLINKRKELESTIGDANNLVDLSKLKDKVELAKRWTEVLKETLEEINQNSKHINKTVNSKTEVVTTKSLIKGFKNVVTTEITDGLGIIDNKSSSIKSKYKKLSDLKLPDTLNNLKYNINDNVKRIKNSATPAILPNNYEEEINNNIDHLKDEYEKSNNEVSKEYFDIEEIINNITLMNGLLAQFKEKLEILNPLISNNISIEFEDTNPLSDKLNIIRTQIIGILSGPDMQDFRSSSLIELSKLKPVLDNLRLKVVRNIYKTGITKINVPSLLTTANNTIEDMIIKRDTLVCDFNDNMPNKTLSEKLSELKDKINPLRGNLEKWDDNINDDDKKIVFLPIDTLVTKLDDFLGKITPFEQLTRLASTTIKTKAKGILTAFNNIINKPEDNIAFAIVDTKTKVSENKRDSKRDQNARLLTNAIYHALVQENYPDLRDEDIERVIKKFYCPLSDPDYLPTEEIEDPVEKQYRKIWQITTQPSTSGVKTLALDLKQSLREKSFFKMIIDEAVAKRLNLFQSGSSPVQPMENALAVLKKFATNNISNEYVKEFYIGQYSMWKSYLNKNGPLYLKDPANNNPLASNSNLLVQFGEKIRKELKVAMKGNPNLENAMDEVLKKNKAYLAYGDSSKKAEVVQAEQNWWKTRIEKELPVVDSYNKLTETQKTFSEKLQSNNTAKEALDAIKKTYLGTAKAAISFAKSISNEVNNISGALDKLKQVRDNIEYNPSKNSSYATHTEKIIIWADTLNKKIISIGKDDKAAWPDANWNDVFNNRVLLKKALYKLGDDKKLIENDLKPALNKFSGLNMPEDILDHIKIDVPYSYARTIETVGENFSTDFADIKSKTDTLRDSVLDFAGKAINTKAYKSNDPTVIGLIKRIKDNASKLLTSLSDKAHQDATPGKDTLTDNSSGKLIKTFETLQTNIQDYNDKNSESNKRKEAYTNITNTFNGTKVDFLKTVADAIGKFNNSQPVAKQLDVEEINNFKEKVKDRITSEVFPKITETSNQFDDLSKILAKGLEVMKEPDTSNTRKILATSFEKLFNGYGNLVQSDDPILTAVLKSGKIKFAGRQYANKAGIDIPRKLKSIYDNEKPADRTDAKLKERISRDLQTCLNDPKIAFLFGVGYTNQAVVGAFKSEFYNSFKHRLAEAVKAEHEANYDYWWLSFFPKAIPLGDKSLQGQSIIEVGFGKSIVPEEQYHRWLQDRLLYSESEEGSHYDDSENTASSSKKDEKEKYERKVRLATSVLNDFIIVLDSSKLSLKYPGIRSELIQSISKFTNPKSSMKKRYIEGIEYLYNLAFNQEIERLDNLIEKLIPDKSELLTIKNEEKSIEVKFNNLLAEEIKLSKAKEEKERTDIQGNINTLKGVIELHKIESLRESLLAKEKTINEMKAKILLKQKKYLTKEVFYDTSDDPIHQFIKNMNEYRVNMNLSFLYKEKLYRNVLAWEYFDIRHVLFAVIVAAETNMALPSKIDLITNAYFDGVRRYTLSPTALEKKILDRYIPSGGKFKNIREPKRHLVVFEDIGTERILQRYLFLKRVNKKSVELLYNRFKCFRESLDKQTKITFKDEIFKEIENEEDEENLKKYVKIIREINDKIIDKLDKSLVNENNEKKPFLLDEYLSKYGNHKQYEKYLLNRFFFWSVKYFEGAKPSLYLQYPELWLWEYKLDQARENLRQLIVNIYHTSYPGVPDAARFKVEFMEKKGHLEAITYQWLRDLWIHINKNHLLDNFFILPDGKKNPTTEEDRKKQKAAKVLVRHLLDRHPYLTKDSQLHLIKTLTSSKNIYDWMELILQEQHVTDQLSANLLDNLYRPLFDSLAKLGKIERQPVPFESIDESDYDSFGHWCKPKVQDGIQIIDMLPASRDDLVSMSINEGGVVAKAAAKAEGAATYDINRLKTLMQVAEKTKQSLFGNRTSESVKVLQGLGTLSESFSDRQQIAKNEKYEDMLNMSRAGSLGGYSLGASASGSLYGRAKAAFAYSRRREYLDAAITAAGRGDNFAKWVVRKSDLRSKLAEKGQKQLVAAAHNGYPNGDQPFHLLVKIPHNSIHADWDGTRYVYFNSSYVATRRLSWWKEIGTLGLIAKLPLLLFNPNWYGRVEESAVGTVYPFKWNVYNNTEQIKLLREPNILGGRIVLDDTDKIKYSEVSTLIEAEANFIKLTRQAQSGDLGIVMEDIKAESGEFRNEVREQIKADSNLIRDLQANDRSTEEIQALKDEIRQLREKVKGIEQSNAEATSSTIPSK